MEIPTRLNHKPILVVEDYNKIDGKYADESDAQFLSIGKAQWDKDNREFSAKVLRHTGKRWSRQSEELPLHRVLDLANLVVSAYWQASGNYKKPTRLKETIHDPDGFENMKSCIKKDLCLKKSILELKKTIEKII